MTSTIWCLSPTLAGFLVLYSAVEQTFRSEYISSHHTRKYSKNRGEGEINPTGSRIHPESRWGSNDHKFTECSLPCWLGRLFFLSSEQSLPPMCHKSSTHTDWSASQSDWLTESSAHTERRRERLMQRSTTCWMCEYGMRQTTGVMWQCSSTFCAKCEFSTRTCRPVLFRLVMFQIVREK